MGFLTGDIVPEGTVKNWDEVDADLASLRLPVSLIVGNHDLTNRDLFESRYGDTDYYFIQNKDLFLVLDGFHDRWNITSEQLLFIRKILDQHASLIDNVFVFFHQLLWWAHDNKYRDQKSNSLEGRATEINFWTDVEPLSGL